MRDRTLLAQLQALPLDAKILMTKQRIREGYHDWHGNVVISFSGGKDSTVLSHLVHEEYPDVPMVFANTGLEYPEIQAFARKMGAEFVRPKMQFSDVISKYGYPIIGKEVAEAISFARRIVPIGGVQQRRGNGQRCTGRETTNLYPHPHNRNQRKNRLEKSKPHRKHSITKSAEDTPYGSQENRSQRKQNHGKISEIRRIERARRQLMGKD